MSHLTYKHIAQRFVPGWKAAREGRPFGRASFFGAFLVTMMMMAPLHVACISEMESPVPSRQGTFAIALESDSLKVEIETRAARELTSTEASAYLVTLTQGDEMIWEQKKFADITLADRTQRLGEGYVVMAENITPEEAENSNKGWGARRNAGSSDPFAIESNKITQVTVPCKMANAGFCVTFDESFTDFFSDFAVTTDDLRGLKFNYSNGYPMNTSTNNHQGAVAYYNTDATTGTHELPLLISASAGWEGTVRLNRTLTLQAGKITRLKVKYNSPELTEGNIILSISYDDSFEDVGGEEIILE